MAFDIRPATLHDARGAVDTLRRSITELCSADHLDDSQEINDWLKNKTVDAWKAWTLRPDAVVLVAAQDDKIIGVGMTTMDGEILLNYVHPDARFRGVSKAMLQALEDRLRALGVGMCQLESTVTAQRFYADCGFRPDPANAARLSKPL